MNLKTLILSIFVIWTGIIFTGCKTSSLIVVTEKNKDKFIEITDTPITIRNEVFWFEVELWEDRSWWAAFPNIRWYDFSPFSWWQYTFELDSMSQVAEFEFWEKKDFKIKEMDPSNEDDAERFRNTHYDEIDWLHFRKIVAKSWEIPKYKWLGYKWDTIRWVFWENNRYYFSISSLSYRDVDKYFKNSSCFVKKFYDEVALYDYDSTVCPNILTDIFKWWFKIFDVE